jgi:dTDP-4-dehydrorhamnose reductase
MMRILMDSITIMIGRYDMNVKNQQKILITGASGFLGYVLCRELKARFRITGSFLTRRTSLPDISLISLDLTDSALAVRDAIWKASPDGIIHAAALANADECESSPNDAWNINTEGSEKLAAAAAERDIPVIYISTDLVYSKGTGPFDETRASPAMVYSRSKFAGEQKILAANPRNAVLRCALMYGYDDGIRTSIVRRMDTAIQNNQTLTLFTDQYRTPLWAPDIANAVTSLLSGKGTARVFNMAGPDRLTRYEFGLIASKIFGWDPKLIKPVKIADLNHLAFRSYDCSLDCSRAIEQLGWTPTPVREGLEKMKGD